MGSSHNRVLHKCPITLLYLLYYQWMIWQFHCKDPLSVGMCVYLSVVCGRHWSRTIVVLRTVHSWWHCHMYAWVPRFSSTVLDSSKSTLRNFLKGIHTAVYVLPTVFSGISKLLFSCYCLHVCTVHTCTKLQQVVILSYSSTEAYSIISNDRHGENCCVRASQFTSQLRPLCTVRYINGKHCETTARTEPLAGVITYKKRADHICPVLENLHWLPINYHIDYKVASDVYKVRSTGSPAYLQVLVSDCTPPRWLLSPKQLFIVKPQWELKLQDMHSAKLLQLSGMICRLIHALRRHTNDSVQRQRSIFMNWLLQTDHVTVSAPTIHLFSDDLWSVTKCI